MGWFARVLRMIGENCFYGVLGVRFGCFSFLFFLFFYCDATLYTSYVHRCVFWAFNILSLLPIKIKK